MTANELAEQIKDVIPREGISDIEIIQSLVIVLSFYTEYGDFGEEDGKNHG